jgi:hypothetical protein
MVPDDDSRDWKIKGYDAILITPTYQGDWQEVSTVCRVEE